MSGDSSEDLVGAVLNGRWRLVRLLGEGGMGAVFEADGPPGVGKRAIKLLHQEYVKEGIILARFFAEFQAARSLQHPNVAQVIETATAENGTPYLVMELLQGTPVASYVDQHQALPMAQAVHIAHGVLQALAAAHAQHIVHRDIKPDNLFLVNDNAGSFNVKVLDFGIAKVMDAAGGMGQKTRTGVLLGTPGYMSPEQIRDSKSVDGRADLWSVGIILYELLAGASPFPADNEFSRLTSVLTEEVRPIGEIMPALASWQGFFDRALAKDPAHRFQTAEEMSAALFSAVRGRSMRPPATLGVEAQPERGSQASFRVVNAVSAVNAPNEGRPSHGGVQTTAMSAYVDRPSSAMALGVTAPASFAIPPTGQSGVLAAPTMQQLANAAAQGAGPPPRTQSLPSTPPPPLGGPLPAAIVVGSNVGPTHVSAQPVSGTATMHAHTPSIEVVGPPPRPGAPYWVIAAVGIVTFALGLGLGLLLR